MAVRRSGPATVGRPRQSGGERSDGKAEAAGSTRHVGEPTRPDGVKTAAGRRSPG